MQIVIDLDLFGGCGAFSIDKKIAKLKGFYLPRSAITSAVLNTVMDKKKTSDGKDEFGRTNFVYFLLDINEAKNISRLIYIGETTDLPTRINTHKKNKKWWNVIVVFSNQDLDETDINAIERILIGQYVDSALYKVDNDQHSHKQIKDYCYEYADYIVSIMDFLSYGITKSVINEIGDVKVEKPKEEKTSGKALTKRPKFKFSMIGLKTGDVISFFNDNSKKFVVYNDDCVLYKGKPIKLSPLAQELLGKKSLRGPDYFKYNGELLAKIRDRLEGISDDDEPKTNKWIVACNKNFYDIDKAFEELPFVDYKQTANIQAGNTVYIYVSKPDKSIAFETEAIVVNKPVRTIDDSKFVKDPNGYAPYNRYMELKLVRRLNSNGLGLKNLKAHGLASTLQGPCRTTVELQKYIDSILKS